MHETGQETLSPPLRALLRRAEDAPDEVALVADGEEWTPQRLLQVSGRVAAGLAARGVGPGDRVAVHMFNTAETVVSYLACLWLGATVLPLNTRLATPELENLVRRTQPRAYLGHHDVYERFAPVARDLVPDHLRFVAGETADGFGGARWRDLEADETAPMYDLLDPGAPAVLLATSGTTGPSKLVIWSHRTLAGLDVSAAERGIRKGTVFSLMTPMTHCSGLYFLLVCLSQDATAVLVRQFTAADVLDQIEQAQVTSVFALPFMYAVLVREQLTRPRTVSTLRHALVAGDVCPPQVETDFERVFTIPLRSCWAATEDVGGIAPSRRSGPYLRLNHGTHVEVVGPGGEQVAQGDVGELVISSPTTSPGYWQGPSDETALSEGAFRSGDLVREVEPGVLRYVSRKKDIIVRGGSNISPHEVEELLRTHPHVADIGVAGYPDPVLGQRVGALVVIAAPSPGSSLEDELRDWALGHLAAHKVPERIRFVSSVPRNAMTKIDRAAVTTTLTND
ncbi:class I adenylate-forming enzyme family protein [Streptomyces sp. NPDC059629]|uniref:class I adenylate-forming enzyme family protein n=1 Tax=Streptomyces sp. NPDC059629 TaxID=3346889 RepID=UPI00367EE483